MNTIRGLLAAFGISIAAVCLFGGVAYATASDQSVQGTTNHTLYKVGGNVTITGTVHGDIFCAGQTITIDATVDGDVLCAGQTINVNGAVDGSVRLVGQTVTLGAKVSNNASIVGQDVTIEDVAYVGQDLSLVGQTATVDGNIGRDFSAVNNMLTINDTIGRNLSVRANDATLTSKSTVGGDVSYTSPHTLQMDNGATVVGNIAYHKSVVHHTHTMAGMVFFKLYWIVAMTVFAIALVALFPQMIRRCNPKWGSEFWCRVLIGFGAMIFTPLVAIILLLTVIGIPLGIALILFWLGASLVSMPLAAYFVGSLIAPKVHPIFMVIIGSILLGLVELIPVIGWIIGLFAYLLGIGTLLAGLQRRYQRPVYVSGKKA